MRTRQREGKIERAIREHLAAHPDEAFTTGDLCEKCYPGLVWRSIKRKHRVAVLRAAAKVLAADPDWHTTWAWDRGNTLVFRNHASLPSVAMADVLRSMPDMDREKCLPKDTQKLLDPSNEWGQSTKARIERIVSEHVAVRDAADPVERERLLAEQKARSEERLASLAQGIRAAHQGAPPQVLSNGNGEPLTTLTALAAKARELTTENDPDAIRDGLREIAAALDGLALEAHPVL